MSKHNQPNQSIYFASQDNIETVQVQVGNLQFTGAQLVGAQTLMKQLFYPHVLFCGTLRMFHPCYAL